MVLLTVKTFAQVGIGTATPETSAVLDRTSTTSGLLPPRMTEAQRNAISAPAMGWMLYCTDCGANGEPQHYNGTSWVNMVGGFALAGPGAITGINCSGATNAVALTYDEVASGVNSTIAYTGGNGNAHSGQTVASTEVTGLIATLTARKLCPRCWYLSL